MAALQPGAVNSSNHRRKSCFLRRNSGSRLSTFKFQTGYEPHLHLLWRLDSWEIESTKVLFRHLQAWRGQILLHNLVQGQLQRNPSWILLIKDFNFHSFQHLLLRLRKRHFQVCKCLPGKWPLDSSNSQNWDVRIPSELSNPTKTWMIWSLRTLEEMDTELPISTTFCSAKCQGWNVDRWTVLQ